MDLTTLREYIKVHRISLEQDKDKLDYVNEHHFYKVKEAEISEEAMDSMVRTECEGRLDMLVELYKLTYDLSFAINDRTKSNE